jgi:hypothetical protein
VVDRGLEELERRVDPVRWEVVWGRGSVGSPR